MVMRNNLLLEGLTLTLKSIPGGVQINMQTMLYALYYQTFWKVKIYLLMLEVNENKRLK